MLPLLAPLLSIGVGLVNKLTDKSDTEKSGLIATLQRFADSGDKESLEAEVQRLSMLAESDKVQAQTTLTSITQGGGKWRDWAGTVCVVALACNFLAIPGTNLIVNVLNSYVPGSTPMQSLSLLPTSDIITLLFGMLGIGGYDMLRNKGA